MHSQKIDDKPDALLLRLTTTNAHAYFVMLNKKIKPIGAPSPKLGNAIAHTIIHPAISLVVNNSFYSYLKNLNNIKSLYPPIQINRNLYRGILYDNIIILGTSFVGKSHIKIYYANVVSIKNITIPKF